MSSFATPFIGVAPSAVTPSAPVPALRFKSDPLLWIGLPAATAIAAFATGCVSRAQGASAGLPGNAADAWTLFQLTPLPQMDRAAFTKISGGLPVQLVLVRGSGVAGPASDTLISAGAPLVTAPAGDPGAYLAFAFQDRLCRDPLSSAEAVAESVACDPQWAGFVEALGALPGARDLRILDHRGAPLSGVTLSVKIDAGAATDVALTPAMDGNTGIAVPAASRATISAPGLEGVILAAAGLNVGAFGASLELPAGHRLVQLTNAANWLAQPDSTPLDDGRALARWNSGCRVEPIQDGIAYFKRLVADLRSAKGGGAAQLAGWVFAKGSLDDTSVDWLLDPDDHSTALIPLLTELKDAGVPLRMLVNQFLQFDSPVIDDFPELLPIIFLIYASLGPLNAISSMQTDPAGYAVAFIAYSAITTISATSISEDLIKKVAELSKPFKEAIDAIDPSIAVWTPYAANFSDNPLVGHPPKILGHTIDDVSHIGVYHQKFVTIAPKVGAPIAYVGGIDINPDRLDTPLHRNRAPFHDLQVRIEGPAVRDVMLTFEDRAIAHGSTPVLPATALVPSPAGASHLVQIARNSYRPASGEAILKTARDGETTPVRTLMSAIASARDFIMIEDQYFTPPDNYVQTLIDAAAPERGVRALMITMPMVTDQPFGHVRRTEVLKALSDAWGDRFHAGMILRRYLHEVPKLTTNLGRMQLAQSLAKAASSVSLTPLIRVPAPPFWMFVDGELMLAHALDGAAMGNTQKVEVVRAAAAMSWGAQPVDHPQGAPAMAAQIPGIYVHAKMMIIDDTFLFAGSSNLNRRGLYHDGEMDAFVLPQHLRGDPTNPARVLRSRLMAEHMGLSTEMGQSLFADPMVGLEQLLARSWYEGGRWQKLDFFGSMPPDVPIGTAGSLPLFILKTAFATLTETELKPEVWPLLSDPTTGSDPTPKPGPDYS